MAKSKNLSYYKNKAWRMFSKYIRTRDCLATTGDSERGKCVTCGKELSFKELQAGHAIGGRSPAILLDEELVNAQCRGCNHFKDGNYGKYSVWFIKKYGLDKWEEKVKLSNMIVKYDKEHYKEKYNEYRDKLNELLDSR
jgi:hypothetical protein